MKKKLSELTDTELLLWFIFSKSHDSYNYFDSIDIRCMRIEISKRKLNIDFNN